MNYYITSYAKAPSYMWSRFMYFILPSFAGWVDQNSFLIMIFILCYKAAIWFLGRGCQQPGVLSQRTSLLALLAERRQLKYIDRAVGILSYFVSNEAMTGPTL